MSNNETVFIKLTGAIVVGGEVVKPPAIVEVTNAEARNLLHRGKGKLATEHDAPPDARSLGADAVLNPEIAAANDAIGKSAELPAVEFANGAQAAPADAQGAAQDQATETQAQDANDAQNAAQAAPKPAPAGRRRGS